MDTPLRIAVADDEPSMRQFLYRTLTYHGHQVVSVSENGRQLVTECHQHRPDLVITDVELSQLDGLTAIQEICRKNPVPAIIITSCSGREVLIRASRELVFAFLVKPIKMDDLRPAIWLTMQRFAEMNSLQLRLNPPD